MIKNKSSIFKKNKYECLNIGNEKFYVNDLINIYKKLSNNSYKFKIKNLNSKDIDPYMTKSNNKKTLQIYKKNKF